MCFCCTRSRIVYAREEVQTRSEVLRSDDEKSSPRGLLHQHERRASSGKAAICTKREITSARRVQHKTDRARAPAIKPFESLRRCVYTHHLHTNAILNTTVYTLKPLHRKQALVFITPTTPPSLTSLPLQTRTPSLPGETSPAQGEDVRLQARYVSSIHISNIFKSLEAIESTENELATEQQRDRLRDTSRHALY